MHNDGQSRPSKKSPASHINGLSWSLQTTTEGCYVIIEPNPYKYDSEDCAVDVVQEQQKAREEQERGDEEKRWHHSGYAMKLPLINPREMESTCICSVE